MLFNGASGWLAGSVTEARPASGYSAVSAQQSMREEEQGGEGGGLEWPGNYIIRNADQTLGTNNWMFVVVL